MYLSSIYRFVWWWLQSSYSSTLEHAIPNTDIDGMIACQLNVPVSLQCSPAETVNSPWWVHVHSKTISAIYRNALSTEDHWARRNNSPCVRWWFTCWGSQRLQVEDQVAAGPTVHMKCRVNLPTSFIWASSKSQSSVHWEPVNSSRSPSH